MARIPREVIMRTVVPAFLAVGFLLLSTAPSPAAGMQQEGKLLDTDTFLEMESVGSPEISPDGQYILFTRGSVDKMNDRSQSDLMIMDLATRRVRELTTGSFNVSSPTWSPDGSKIAFISDRSGTSQIHMMWLDTRETIQLTNLDRAPGGIRWSPDGSRISFTMFIPDTGSPLTIKMPSFPRGANLAAPAVVEDRSAWESDGRGYNPKGATQIFIVDAELGGTPRQITSGDQSHSNPQWSPDGSKLYFSGDLIPEEGYEPSNSEVHVIDLATLEITTLTDRLGPDNGPLPSPDGRLIAYTGYDENDNYSNLSSLYLMGSDGSNARLLAGDLPNSPSDITWARDGSGLYYTMGEEGSSNLYFVSTAGAIRAVTEGVHYISGISIAENGTVAATNSTFYRPSYLITFDVDRPDRITTLVDFNDDVLDGTTLGQVEEIWTESSDGLRVQGWLMKPANFEEGKKYPMVPHGPLDPWRPCVHVHGSLELELAEPRRQRLRRALDESPWKHRIRPGVRERDQLPLSGYGFRRPHGGRGCRHRPRVHRRGQPLRDREQWGRGPHGLDRGAYGPVPGRGFAAPRDRLAVFRGHHRRGRLVPAFPVHALG